MPFDKSLTGIFNLFGVHVQCGGYAPGGEALSRDTGAFQDALLGGTQLLELHLDHLLQRVRNTDGNSFKRRAKHPSSLLVLRDQSLLNQVVQNSSHEQSVSARLPINQRSKASGKAAARKLCGQVLSDVRRF